MPTRSIKKLFFLTLLLSITACSAWGSWEFERDFQKMTSSERKAFILSHPVAERIDVYVQGILAVKPPDLSLADVVASGGQEILPFLKERLCSEQSDIVKVHLIDVFYRMQRGGFYSVVDDPEVMAFLSEQVSGMEDPEWRRLAQRNIDWIKEFSEPEIQ